MAAQLKNEQASIVDENQNNAEDSKEEKKEEKINYEKPKIQQPPKEMLDKLTDEMTKLYSHNKTQSQKTKKNPDGSVTFYPTPAEMLTKRDIRLFDTEKMTLGDMINEQECARPLAYSNEDEKIIKCDHLCSFIDASITAWSQHYPFKMKPEHIWLLILQSVAVHVDANAEKLRNKYVKFQGKKKLTVQISANPSAQEWAATISNFAQQIDKNTVDDTVKLFDCDFTSSTMTEKIATKVTIMDICKNFFDYSCTTDCGWPQITLAGTQQDWIKLKQKTIQLLKTKTDKNFGEKWGAALVPVLDRFIVAFDGEIDCVFWNSMIKRGSIYGSGAYSWFTGWFNVFFPFINKQWNRWCEPYNMDKTYVQQGLMDDGNLGGENDMADYPKGLATAPVEWNNNGKIEKLKFIAGFIGYKQDPKTLELIPNIGWCVAHEMNEQELKVKRDKEQEEEDW